MIKNLFQLRIIYFIVWVVPIILALTYKLIFFGKERYLVNNLASTYILSTISIFLSLGIIYIALKTFKFSFISKSLQKNKKEQQLRIYIKWNIIRYILLLGIIIFDLFVYFYTSNKSGLFCAIITLISATFCYPTEKEIPNTTKISNSNKNL